MYMCQLSKNQGYIPIYNHPLHLRMKTRSCLDGRRGYRYARTAMVASQDGSKELQLTSFPRDYVEAMRQAQDATKKAQHDGWSMIEIEFPPSSLVSVAGDGEGANEMTYSAKYLRQYCRLFGDSASTTRIFFPDEKEMKMQQSEEGEWGETKFQLDFLTKPSGLLDIGIDVSGYSAAAKDTDEVFVFAYPSFDPRELVAADKVCQIAKKSIEKGKQITCVFFNAELDRLRSNYYPSLFYPNMARLSKDLIPDIQTAYYIHNFKGPTGGVLFRKYPEPWQVMLRLQDGQAVVVHVQDKQPSLKEVSLDILPRVTRDFLKSNRK